MVSFFPSQASRARTSDMICAILTALSNLTHFTLPFRKCTTKVNASLWKRPLWPSGDMMASVDWLAADGVITTVTMTMAFMMLCIKRKMNPAQFGFLLLLRTKLLVSCWKGIKAFLGSLLRAAISRGKNC